MSVSARAVFPDRILTDGEAQEVQPNVPLVRGQRVTETRFAWLQFQPYVLQPAFYERLSLLHPFFRGMEYGEVVGVPDNLWSVFHLVRLDQGAFHAVQGDVHQQGRDYASLRGSPFGGCVYSLCEYSRFEPAFDSLPHCRVGVQLP